MTSYPILFNQTPESLRRIGACGGRARARNWHARQRHAHIPTIFPACSPQRLEETTAQAIARLDAQFPWLRRAEQSTRR